jgi:transposase
MGKVKARTLREEEVKELEKVMKSSNRTVVWRSQAIMMSAKENLNPRQIAERLGYGGEIIRRVIHRFNERGLSVIYPQSRARQDDQRAFDDASRERLKQVVRQSPRDFGIENSLWTLSELAQVSYEQGLTDQVVHPDTVSETLHRLGIGWKKAKRTIQSPDENYETKKNDEIGSK